ncbi:MAG: HAD hydrolase family protein [Verrucomicrobia bacterium]|nr:HAD hydrolase family protein [Verrucomicrobiota bacterium]
MRKQDTKVLNTKLARIKLLLCDVDGVLTNATVFLGKGGEFKQFNILDGLGMRILQREGVRVGWISNRPSAATKQRAEELKVDFLYQADGNKVAAAEAILAKTELGWDEVCFMGDDVVDLGAMRRAGVPVTVANGIPEAKNLALYVTKAEGGHGAVREVARLILKAQKKWDAVVKRYLH